MAKFVKLMVLSMTLVGGAAQAADTEFRLDLAKGCRLVQTQQDEAPRVLCGERTPGRVELRSNSAQERVATSWSAGRPATHVEPRLGQAGGPMTIAIGY